MTITEYRKQLNQQGYKTRRVNGENIAYKDGVYYEFSLSGVCNEPSIVSLGNMESFKNEYKQPIFDSFSRLSVKNK
jgi:hypothetical protein